MSTLRDAIESYLALRRGLGSQLRDPARRLRHFADFLEGEAADVVTTELALRWATAAAGVTAATWAQRLGDVRRFATWLSATDPRTEVPPHGLLPYRYLRSPSYIYSNDEIDRIVQEATRLPSPLGLRALTYSTLFGLLASTGLRLGEAIALDRDDVDTRAGVLAIRHAKFGKSRFVPTHDSTSRALQRYARQRDSLVANPLSPAFLLAEGGARLTQDSARYNFVVVSRAIGLRRPGHGRHYGHGPRLHDMRHRLAVSTLVRWYREGRDVERELPKLSTYLGHVHVADTYWYLQGVPELLQRATERATSPREDAP
jgi:integrase